MNGVEALNLKKKNAIFQGEVKAHKIEINLDRVATWTLIFTNTFFVSYFFAKLLQWI